MKNNNVDRSVEIAIWGTIAVLITAFAYAVHYCESGSSDIARPEISGYSQENAVGSMLKANHPEVSDDRIKSGAKKIINEWNEATRK